MPRSITTLFLASAPLWAQGTATILGTVTDSTGSVAPNAPLTAVQVTTGMSRNTVSDQRGDYVIPQLPTGTYRLAAEGSGFKNSILTDITRQVNDNRRQHI